jgi:nucleoside permease NupC
MIERLQPLLGLVVIGLIAYAFSTNRRAIKLRTIAWASVCSSSLPSSF